MNTTIEINDSEERNIYEESFERASADLEMLCAAYPDEIAIFQPESIMDEGIKSADDHNNEIPSWFPLIFTLSLPGTTDNSSSMLHKRHKSSNHIVTLEFPKGYPAKELQIVSYRTSNLIPKEIIEKVVTSIRSVAKESVELYGGEECGLACCSAALECWNESLDALATNNAAILEDIPSTSTAIDTYDDIEWISSDKTLTDRKSVFQAHVCVVDSEEKVRRAVRKLIDGSSKIQRASHNMFAYRFTETLKDGKEILKHDNDDDGEDAAGSRLAHLLEMKKEDGVLVLVSRWYGGVHLGPKRFAHISNVARDLLVECHEKQLIS